MPPSSPCGRLLKLKSCPCETAGPPPLPRPWRHRPSVPLTPGGSCEWSLRVSVCLWGPTSGSTAPSGLVRVIAGVSTSFLSGPPCGWTTLGLSVRPSAGRPLRHLPRGAAVAPVCVFCSQTPRASLDLIRPFSEPLLLPVLVPTGDTGEASLVSCLGPTHGGPAVFAGSSALGGTDPTRLVRGRDCDFSPLWRRHRLGTDPRACVSCCSRS